MKNAGLCSPLISTVGGCRLNCSGAGAAPAAPPPLLAATAVTCACLIPAAAQAAGLVIPALVIASAIFACWAGSSVNLVLENSCGAGSPLNRVKVVFSVIDTLEPRDKPPRLIDTECCPAGELRTGAALTSIPGLLASVPRTNSAFLG